MTGCLPVDDHGSFTTSILVSKFERTRAHNGRERAHNGREHAHALPKRTQTQ